MSFFRIKSSPDPDADLVTAYQETGDLTMLAKLYGRYMELVYGVCLKYFENVEEAKDAVLNIYEELVEKLKKHEVTNFRPWLHRVATNHCLMKLRARKVRLVNFDAERMHFEDDFHLSEVIRLEGQLEMMEFCLTKLNAQQNLAVTMFYLKNHCYKSIAATMCLEAGKVRSLIQNGKRNLKTCMQNSLVQKAE